MSKQRIELMDSPTDMVMKMCETNPGAMNVLLQMMGARHIDPDNVMGSIGPVMFLDTLGIYGADIYVLHNDICDRDMVKTLAVLRAVQLGMFDGEMLAEACTRQDRSGRDMVQVEHLLESVQERFPNFGLQLN